MCGIIGLLIKEPALRPALGEFILPMLVGMSDRGPDSAGLAVFGEPATGEQRQYSLYAGGTIYDWMAFQNNFIASFDAACELTVHHNQAVMMCDREPIQVKQWLQQQHPQLALLSMGQSINLYKDTGLPSKVAERYKFSALQGSHAIGHTRMATESAVTPAHAHPFTAGEDFCLVHNGSLSNPYSIRRQLEPQGIHFDTDNDTEAACRFLEWRLSLGDDLETAIRQGFAELDGFYTFLIGTANKLALVRDAFACKPAVVAETNDYVAIASEFRSLAHLPNIDRARIYEPAPEEIYVWSI